jgi:multiple sugar transport system ATP-binding protein
MHMAGVVIRNISKRFGPTKVLRNISLHIDRGEFMTLVGPSGCGKSTLLRIIAGLEAQNEGQIFIEGACVDQKRAKDRRVAMVFQSYALYPHMTVFDNIALPLRMRRLKRSQRMPVIWRLSPRVRRTLQGISTDVAEVARLLGIEHVLHRKPGQLSGGQAQRVALGRAMVRQPSVFLMDEPLSNLDAALRVQMRAEIARLHRRLRSTFIYVTHDQAEAMTMSDRVAVMMEGRILQVSPPDEIYGNPMDLRVARFIGSPTINTLPCKVTAGGALEVIGHTVAIDTGLPAGTRVTLAVRPEAVACSWHGSASGIAGRVTFLENLGSEVLALVGVDRLEDPVTVRLEPQAARGATIGTKVRLRLPPDRLLLFDQQGGRVAPALPVSGGAIGVAHG